MVGESFAPGTQTNTQMRTPKFLITQEPVAGKFVTFVQQFLTKSTAQFVSEDRPTGFYMAAQFLSQVAVTEDKVLA
jgi:hypothetical protein